MDLYRSCSVPKCTIPGAFAHYVTEKVFCFKHLPAHDQLSEFRKTTSSLTPTQLSVIGHTLQTLDSLSQDVISRIKQQRDIQINALLTSIQQINKDAATNIQKALTKAREIYEELQAVLQTGELPLDSTSRFIGKLVKRQEMSISLVTTEIQAWLEPTQPSRKTFNNKITQTTSEVAILEENQGEMPKVLRDQSSSVLELACQYGFKTELVRLAVSGLCKKTAVIQGVSLEGVDLSHVDFSGGVFIGASFDRSNLSHAKFMKTILIDCSFRGCDMRGCYIFPPKLQIDSSIHTIACASNGNSIAFGGPNLVLLWVKGKRTKTINPSTELKGLTFSPDNKFIAIASRKEITFWDLAREQTRNTIHTSISIQGIMFSSQGTTLAVAGWWPANILIYDFETNHLLSTIQTEAKFLSDLCYSAHTPHYLAITNSNCEIQVWDTRNFSLIRTFQEPSWSAPSKFNEFKMMLSATNVRYQTRYCIRFYGKYLLSGGHDGILRMWDIENDQCVRVIQGPLKTVWSLDAQDRFIVAADKVSNIVALYDETGFRYAYYENTRSANEVVLTPCEKFVLAANLSQKEVRTYVNNPLLKDWAGFNDTSVVKQYTKIALKAAILDHGAEERLNS